MCIASDISFGDSAQLTLDMVLPSAKYAVPAMRRAGGGYIIIRSSVAGLRESAGLAGYCATKGGVRLFAKAVAMECAADADGIRVNTVHPGIIDTPIWNEAIRVRRAQRADRPARGRQSRAAARQGWTGSVHREWCAVPRL
jgi:NAD(P)-dependent dehydrogenase (short-subunit alcohol dehydrogenase family)